MNVLVTGLLTVHDQSISSPSSVPIKIISTPLPALSNLLTPKTPIPKTSLTPTGCISSYAITKVATPSIFATPVTPKTPITPITPTTPVTPITPLTPVNSLKLTICGTPKLDSSSNVELSLEERPQTDLFLRPQVSRRVRKKESGDDLVQKIKKYEKKLKKNSKVTSTVLSKIFRIENKYRKVVEKFPNPEFLPLEHQQNLVALKSYYHQVIIPTLNKAKISIVKRPMHAAVQAAAAKGKAAQAGLSALKNLSQNHPWIQKNVDSCQTVCLLPEEGAVFKSLAPKGEEEERIVNFLFDLSAEQAVVGTFQMGQSSLKHLGIPVPLKIKERGFTLETLSPLQLNNIKARLSPEQLAILNKLESDPKQETKGKKYYHRLVNREWDVQLPGQEKIKVSFKALQKLNIADKLTLDTLIISPSNTLSWEEHICQNTPLFRALNYLPTFEEETFYLVPDLKDFNLEQNYERCEHCEWTFIDSQGLQQTVNFKTLFSNYLGNQEMHKIVPSAYGKNDFPTNEELQTVLDVPWKVFSSEIMFIEKMNPKEVSSPYKTTPACNIQAKPFIDDMILLENLDLEMREVILQRLTEEGQFDAILTSELQLLDLHANNLGVHLESNEAYEHYKNVEFILPSQEKKTFKDLLFDHLKGHLQPDTWIRFQDNEKNVAKPLKELPELQLALDVRWNLVIFDTDISLSEDNQLQLQTRAGVEEHLIPLRSVLLETNWKYLPLSEAVIQRLMHSEDRDHQIDQWTMRADAPIYKRLSSSAIDSIKHQIYADVEKYSLSIDRGNRTTIRNLSKQFADEVSDVAHPVWQTVEQDLFSSAQNSRKRSNPEEQVARKKACLESVSLTSPRSEASRKRKIMAAQFFPRITLRQHRALVERQQHRKSYLENYQIISQSTLSGIELVNLIEAYLNASTRIFSTKRLAAIQKVLATHKEQFVNHPETLAFLKQMICIESHPSYFNLTKAMYPLLADAYELNQAVYAESLGYARSMAGNRIGLYDKPLQETIRRAKNMFAADSDEVRLALHLEQCIANHANPAFFRHLN